MPLDAFELTEVGFLKIDAEDAEAQVLRGARQTIVTSKPKMMVEIVGDRIGEKRLRCLVGWIEDLGYDCLSYTKRTLTAFRHSDCKRDRNVHNFIFLPAP